MLDLGTAAAVWPVLCPLRPPTHCPDCHRGVCVGGCCFYLFIHPQEVGFSHWVLALEIEFCSSQLDTSDLFSLSLALPDSQELPEHSLACPGRSSPGPQRPLLLSAGSTFPRCFGLDYGTDTPRMAADTKCQVTPHTCLMMILGQGIWCCTGDDRDRNSGTPRTHVHNALSLRRSGHGSPK